MKKLTFTLLLGLASLSFIQAQSLTNSSWDESKRKQHLENVQDPTTWDMEMVETDKPIIEMGLDFGPFPYGVFPVPKYELTAGDSEVAVGNTLGRFKVNGKSVYMNSFQCYKNPVNEGLLGDAESKSFFQIIILTESTEEDGQFGILSRNHPDYMGQGYLDTEKGRIDYAAFITAEGDSFAIVNSRLFNLNYGTTVLIAPQEDGTLRSMQIDSPALTVDEVQQYSEELLTKAQVKQFFK